MKDVTGDQLIFVMKFPVHGGLRDPLAALWLWGKIGT
jgi:hypothetical protein